jgi:hypothetical protein
MQFEISVIEQAGQKVFRYQDANSRVLFNRLIPFDELIGGNLIVRRGGSEIARTRQIDKFNQGYGDSTGSTCFMGLTGIFGKGHSDAAWSFRLEPDALQVGDVIVVDIPGTLPHESFTDFLIERYRDSERRKSDQPLERQAEQRLPAILTFGHPQ